MSLLVFGSIINVVAMFPPITVKSSGGCLSLSFADEKKVSFTSMTVYGYTLLDSAGAHCPDACVEPHGRVYASYFFSQ